MEYTHPDNCDCYKCIGEKKAYENGHVYTVNNMEHHTFGEACDNCGKPKSEYKDLGRKGRYTCWWCNKRARQLE